MNAHQPKIVRNEQGVNRQVECVAPDCNAVIYAGAAPDATYLNIFMDHARQYEPGHAPNITVEFVISADCSVCEDGGDVDMNDSDTVVCGDCGTSWYIDGTGGERE